MIDYLANIPKDVDYSELNQYELNELKNQYFELIYKDDEPNYKITKYLKNFDLNAIAIVIETSDEIFSFLEILSRLNTIKIDYDESFKDLLLKKYLDLLKTVNSDDLIDVFDEVCSFAFASYHFKGKYSLLEVYDLMIIKSFKDDDYTKLKIKIIKEVSNFNKSKANLDYLNKIKSGL